MSPGPDVRNRRLVGFVTVKPALAAAGVTSYTPSCRFAKLNVPVESEVVFNGAKPGKYVMQLSGPVGGDVAPAESSQRRSVTVMPGTTVMSDAFVITPLATVVLKRNVKFVRPSLNTVLVLKSHRGSGTGVVEPTVLVRLLPSPVVVAPVLTTAVSTCAPAALMPRVTTAVVG